MSKLQIKKLHQNASIPFYASDQAAGMDLSYSGSSPVIITPGCLKLLPTGIAIALQKGYEAQIRPRSGLAAKHYVTVLNSPGTIDADYRGEIKVILINHGDKDFIVEPGMRIAQMLIAQYASAEIEEVEMLDNTERGEGGFGSTGLQLEKAKEF